jgi:triosephosphate isomerase (TIM)
LRTKLIAGNWKMNKTVSEARQLVEQLIPLVKDSKNEVAVCVPFTSIAIVAEMIKDTNIALGAQNIHWEKSGAFTGEISGSMLVELGVKYVIVGHSERRQFFGETDYTVNKRSKAALSYGLRPIICVGETLEQRESGKEKDVVKEQIEKAFEGIEGDDLKDIVIAYEPIWAIGTGKSASSQDAVDMVSYIRSTIEDLYGSQGAEIVRIQYGGSVKGSNAKEYLSNNEIDGALVGGASLVAADFNSIVNF